MESLHRINLPIRLCLQLRRKSLNQSLPVESSSLPTHPESWAGIRSATPLVVRRCDSFPVHMAYQITQDGYLICCRHNCKVYPFVSKRGEEYYICHAEEKQTKHGVAGKSHFLRHPDQDWDYGLFSNFENERRR